MLWRSFGLRPSWLGTQVLSVACEYPVYAFPGSFLEPQQNSQRGRAQSFFASR
jgi:hypothetical protein